jgi:transcription elongation factor Elf1
MESILHKTCLLCGEEKSILLFSVRDNGKIRNWCKECMKTYKREWRNLEHNKEYRARSQESSKARKLINSLKIDAYLKTHPCVDCGETDIVKLEFDHVRGTKINHISYMEANGVLWPKIKEEIAKCEVRCRNCHRKKTLKDVLLAPKGESYTAKSVLKVKQKIDAYLKTHPCVDCGETDIVVLDFDHVKGSKEFNLSEGKRKKYPLPKLMAEIDKCEVRCANCHILKTAIERNFGRYKRSRGLV